MTAAPFAAVLAAGALIDLAARTGFLAAGAGTSGTVYSSFVYVSSSGGGSKTSFVNLIAVYF